MFSPLKQYSLRRSMAITIAGNGLTSLFWLMTGMLAARLLGPQGRGELAAIQTWGLFLATFALLGMPDALVYFTARDPGRTASYTVSAVLIALLGGLPLLCFGYLAMPLLLSAQNHAVISEARLYLLIGVTAMLGQVPLNALRGRSDFFLWNTLRVIGAMLGLVPLLLAWLLNRRTPEFVATTNIFCWGALFSLIIIWTLALRVPGPFQPHLSDWKSMLSFGLPSLMTILPQNLNLRLDQMLMAAVVAPRLLGLYVVAVGWAAIMMPLFQAIAIVLFPHIASRTSRTEQVSALMRVLRFGVPLALISAAGLAMITPWGLPLIFGGGFAASIGSAIVLVFAGAILGINQMLAEGLRGLGSPKSVMWSELGGLIVTLILLGLLLKPMGIMGAALASLFGYGTVTIQLLYWTRELTGCAVSELLLPTGSEIVEVLGHARVWLHGLCRVAAE
jgi:O-antigen/teichoic acid export membrane protein